MGALATTEKASMEKSDASTSCIDWDLTGSADEHSPDNADISVQKEMSTFGNASAASSKRRLSLLLRELIDTERSYASVSSSTVQINVGLSFFCPR